MVQGGLLYKERVLLRSFFHVLASFFDSSASSGCCVLGSISGCVSSFTSGFCSLVRSAFGSFTGMHRIKPRAGDRVFAVAEDLVRKVSN